MTTPLAYFLQQLLDFSHPWSKRLGWASALVSYPVMRTFPFLGQVPEQLSLMRFAAAGSLECICAEHLPVQVNTPVECLDRRDCCRECGGLATRKVARFNEELSEVMIANHIEKLRLKTFLINPDTYKSVPRGTFVDS